MAAEDLRAKIRGSIDRAIKEAKKRATVANVEKANADMVGQAQALERRGFDDAAERGLIAPRVADQYRALNLTPPASERQSDKTMRAEQAETKRFEEDMLHRNLPNYPTIEQEERLVTPPSVRGLEVGPELNYATDELGQPQASSAEQIRLLEQALADAYDRELEREISAPVPPAPAPAPAPPRPGSVEALGPGTMMSDERAKKAPSAVPAGVRSSALGGEPGVSDLGMLHGSAGPEMNRVALRTDPGGGRIDANNPEAFLESTIEPPARTGLAATPTAARQNLGAKYQAEVAESRSGPRKGLAAGGEEERLARIKRGLEFMSAIRSTRPEMIDLTSGMRRYG